MAAARSLPGLALSQRRQPPPPDPRLSSGQVACESKRVTVPTPYRNTLELPPPHALLPPGHCNALLLPFLLPLPSPMAPGGPDFPGAGSVCPLPSRPHPSNPPPQDTLRDCDQESTCYNTVISPIYFVSFVLTAQFVLVNVVIAVLMKHLEESNKEAKEEAELEAELELEMKTLSPQPPSPLGSPFLWPGVDGPDSPGSPKPGAPEAAARAGAASHFSLEHPMVSNPPHKHPLERVWDGDGWHGCSVVGHVQGAGSKQTSGLLNRSDPPAWMQRSEQAPACPQRLLPTLEARGQQATGTSVPVPPAWPGRAFPGS